MYIECWNMTQALLVVQYLWYLVLSYTVFKILVSTNIAGTIRFAVAYTSNYRNRFEVATFYVSECLLYVYIDSYPF